MTNALTKSVPTCPWLRLCRFVLAWLMTRPCTRGPSITNAVVTPVRITA